MLRGKGLEGLKKLSLGLTLVLTMGVFTPVNAFSDGELKLRADLSENINKRVQNFNISYSGSTENISEVVTNAIRENTKGTNDYLVASINEVRAKIKYNNNKAEINFNIEYVSTHEEESYVNEKVKEIVSKLITPQMDDITKIKVLNKWVIENVKYDYTLSRHNAYNALVDGNTVCRGYALLMDKLLEEANISSVVARGNIKGEPHAWNIVKLGGKWLHIDTTNNLQSKNKYFLCSDSDMKEYGFTWDPNEIDKLKTNYK